MTYNYYQKTGKFSGGVGEWALNTQGKISSNALKHLTISLSAPNYQQINK